MIPVEILLAEILRLQRWAGGDTCSAARIFGLMNGFESAIDLEAETFGITRDQQEKVEDILEEIEAGNQPCDGYEIKQRLIEDDIDETVASKVIKLCILDGRFTDATDRLTAGDSHFAHLKPDGPEVNWLGALHYMELVDCTEGTHKKLHGVYAAGVPRVGDVISPQNGPAMIVDQVEWQMFMQGENEGMRLPTLVPYVYLKNEIDDPS